MSLRSLTVCLLALTACQRAVPHSGGRLAVDWPVMQQRCDTPAATMQAVVWTAYLLVDNGPSWLVEMRSAPAASDEGARLLRLGRLTSQKAPEPVHTEWLTPETVDVGRDRLRFGASTLTRRDDGSRFELHVVATANSGRVVTLDAELRRRHAPWLPKPTALPTFDDSATCLDVAVLVPRADLVGSISLDGETTALRGTAYLDRVAWLASPQRDHLMWYRGVAHADNHAAVFFEPLQRSARSRVYLGDPQGCQLCAAEAPLSVPLPGPAARLIELSYVHRGRVLRLRATTPAFAGQGQGGTVLVPGTLDLSDPQGRTRLAGPTVIDLGVWRTQ